VLALQLPAMGQASTEFLDTVYIREQISKYESAGRSRRQPQLSDQEFAELEREIPYTGFTPLTEMGPGQTYKGQDGGLYGSGSNNPPPAHQKAALEAVAKITPRDEDGNPSADGKIVLMGIGMSNTRIIFDMFKQMAEADPGKADRVILVNAAAAAKTPGRGPTPPLTTAANLTFPEREKRGQLGITPTRCLLLKVSHQPRFKLCGFTKR